MFTNKQIYWLAVSLKWWAIVFLFFSSQVSPGLPLQWVRWQNRLRGGAAKYTQQFDVNLICRLCMTLHPLSGSGPSRTVPTQSQNDQLKPNKNAAKCNIWPKNVYSLWKQWKLFQCFITKILRFFQFVLLTLFNFVWFSFISPIHSRFRAFYHFCDLWELTGLLQHLEDLISGCW